MNLLKSRRFILKTSLILYAIASLYFLYGQFTCRSSEFLCSGSVLNKILFSMVMPFFITGPFFIFWILIMGMCLAVIYGFKTKKGDQIIISNIIYLFLTGILVFLYIKIL